MTRIHTRLFTAAAALVLGVGAGAAAAPAASATTVDTGHGRAHPFAVQARAAGLNATQAAELQRQVDVNLAAFGGSQVGANKIALGTDGVLLLPLPGEARARDLDAKEAGILDAPCDYNWACTFEQPWYAGRVIKLYECGKVSNPWRGTGSWYNNQSSNYHMKFYNHTGDLGWTSPGGPSSDPTAPWDWVGYVSPC
ncbi:hypothetical protein DR950_06170 [Kitasatospora xanthocidica]|uniref:Peptidase inhibitor family I36 protein n=1 Tax=Kitasatospora xanthocidica TaxID=83382 RepID=A0A372ZQF5_9ACTN|nr:hypothetical protein [Kitasatospora xanthocidica]RGD57435.1 hypothetical protein DR950_06170 [Kitasatospora xanthocidica]